LLGIVSNLIIIVTHIRNSEYFKVKFPSAIFGEKIEKPTFLPDFWLKPIDGM
jgi:hypothetical protein